MNIVLPIENSNRMLVGVRNELFLLDWNRPGDSALRFVAAFDQGLPDNILNEGKIDARGRFWGGKITISISSLTCRNVVQRCVDSTFTHRAASPEGDSGTSCTPDYRTDHRLSDWQQKSLNREKKKEPYNY